MPEWWTYRLSDFLMFEPKTYYRLFELYNRALWPGQIAALALGVTLLVLVWRDSRARRERREGRLTPALLAVAWLWVAWAFHWRHYASINSAAPYFAAGFAAQALLLLVTALVPIRGLRQAPPHQPDGVGLSIVLFAVVIQPLIGPLQGRSWAGLELFALAPDPTVTATLGLLLVAAAPWVMWIIPLLWCVITGATLWAMDAPDAWVVPGVGVAGVAWAAHRKRREGR